MLALHGALAEMHAVRSPHACLKLFNAEQKEIVTGEKQIWSLCLQVQCTLVYSPLFVPSMLERIRVESELSKPL
jgi:hypothetical protein